MEFATYVKAYLYGLGKCYEGETDITNEAIAQALDILETDVSKAWRHWKRAGLVHSEGKGVLVFDPLPVETVKAETAPAEKEAEKETAKTASMKEISKAMGINPKMKQTVITAEQLLKKPLSQREITSLYTFMQEYSMSQEMVMVLLEYCATLDKTSFSFIEKVAENWHKQGVTTLREATKVLNNLNKELNMIKKCKKNFGLDREFTQTEKNYISNWVSEFSMSEAMIKNAYERTIANTGKLSMRYMNSILKAWFEKGIKTVSQIAEKEPAPAVKGKGKTGGYQLDDMAALERKLRLQKQKN